MIDPATLASRRSQSEGWTRSHQPASSSQQAESYVALVMMLVESATASATPICVKEEQARQVAQIGACRGLHESRSR